MSLGLSFTTFIHHFHGIGTAEHRLKFMPTSPDGLPSGRMIVLSVLMSAEPGHGVVEIMNRPVTLELTVSPSTQN